VLDFAGEFAMYTSVPAAIIVLVWMLVGPRPSTLALRIPAGFLSALAVGWVMFIFGWAILLRDGLGPDAVTSHGLEALRRMEQDLRWALFAVPPGIAGCTLYLLARRRARAVRPTVG
jgi:hypothetical protein